MKKLLLILSIFLVFKTAFSQNLQEYLNKADVFINQGDLNQASEILKTGKQKALGTSGENSDIYADFCEKTGLVYLYAKKYSEAKKQWISALGIRKKIHGNNHIKISDSYNNLALLYAETGDYYRSLKLYQKSLKIRKELLPPDDLKLANTLFNTGRACLKTYNPDLAIKYFSEALKIRTKKDNSFSNELAALYSNYGDAYKMYEDYDKSYENYQKALRIMLHNYGENNIKTAGIYAKTADVLNIKGDYDKALEYSKKALAIYKEKYGEEHRAIAKILINIGSVFLNQGKIKEAVENFNRSLEISKKLYKTWDLKTAEQYTEIGLILSNKSKNTAALSYFNNALTIQRNVFQSDNHFEIARTFINIGNAYINDNEYYSAIENYNKSLPILLKISGNKNSETARVYFLLASAYKLKKDFNSVLKYLQKSLISNTENFNSQDIAQNPDLSDITSFYFDEKLLSETLMEKAGAFRSLYLRKNNTDFLKKSCKVYEAAGSLIENFNKTAFLNADKKYLRENIYEIYEKATALCIQLYKKTGESKYFNKAFMFAEKNKKGILPSVSEVAEYADMTDDLLSSELNLKSDIAYFRKKVTENTEDEKIITKLNSLLLKFNSFISNLKENHKKYYEYKYYTSTTTISDIQKLISAGTLVLDYFSPQSSNYIYVFAFTKNQEEISLIKNINDFNFKLKNFRKHILSNNETYTEAYSQEAFSLYNDLIPDKFKDDLSVSQLFVVPDGNIGMIPFDALLTEQNGGNSGDFNNFPFLIKKYAVSYSVSGNFLQKSLLSDTVTGKDSLFTDDWAGVAPVFDSENTNISSAEIRSILKKVQNTFQVNSKTGFLNGNNISLLPESENEVSAIYNEFEKAGKSAETDIREEADENFFKQTDPEEFRYIHIASHTFINSDEPDLSGFITAHSPDDENDGVLFLKEFFDLELYSDLLVFPYCETGFGKFKRNESIRTFVRAVNYTGTENIILSLWQVRGEANKELMLNFYKNILSEDNFPVRYINSLRRAKLKMIEDGKYAHPFYWSPFILIGN